MRAVARLLQLLYDSDNDLIVDALSIDLEVLTGVSGRWWRGGLSDAASKLRRPLGLDVCS